MALYAGFDCSTQRLSVVVIDAGRRTVVYRDSLPFAEPFVVADDPAVVHASPEMWAAALETMLGRVARNIDRTALRAISGSAQQHGSVYCGDRPDTLTRETSPIWMDSSTARECDEIEAALGGASALAQFTGSRAFPRFTGPQIRKFWRDEPDAYARTARIHLVSSFLASVLTGTHAPIDHADASGMNLMDIRTREWSVAAMAATAPGLREKLPPLVPSSTVIGTLDGRWQDRFALPPVRIVAWSGDNPCSMIGTGLVHEGQLAVSLGTSDTIFGPMREPRVSHDGTGHVFASVLGAYMGITVFRNGSLARERVRDAFGWTWDDLSKALRQTPAGNGGALMLPWFEPEITPPVSQPSVVRVGLDRATPAQQARAIIEAQMMALSAHSAWMGVTLEAIFATGGAAANRDILQVLADVFAADVHRFDASDSAALGAALRAWQAHSGLDWPTVVGGFATPPSSGRVRPITEHVRTYQDLQRRYIALEAAALAR
ncbi:MAG: FGGY family carbohydrate kinase [Vicinamibacterales bacterium]